MDLPCSHHPLSIVLHISLRATDMSACLRQGMGAKQGEQAEHLGSTLHGFFPDIIPQDRSQGLLRVKPSQAHANMQTCLAQDMEGKQREKAERLRFGRFFYRFPNGESGADVYDRMTIFEDHLIRDINAGRSALPCGDQL